jgi:hypothetical protein
MQVSLFDVVYWRKGRALRFFYEPTPVTKNKDMVPFYSPVNFMVKITSMPLKFRISYSELERFM